MLRKQFGNGGFVVEWGVIHNDQRVRLEFGDQSLLDPGGDGLMGAASGKSERSKPFLASLRHDEINAALSAVSSDLAMDLDATPDPSVRAIAVRFKPALIKVHHVTGAMFLNPQTQVAQKSHSGAGMTLSVARRFF